MLRELLLTAPDIYKMLLKEIYNVDITEEELMKRIENAREEKRKERERE